MNVQAILQAKGQDVHSIHPNASLADVVQELVARNCGSLVVMDGDRLIGIVTERDILRACAGDQRELSAIPLRERMTSKVLTGRPEDDVTQVMGVLTQNRVRHLPIMDGEKLVGLVSIGDVVKAQHDRLSLENQYLKEYIQS